MKKLITQFKNGFTLAEVLITLVIIGVVAALTVSPIINTYRESSTVAKVKKGLSILGQAKKLAEVQNGSIEGWDFGENSDAESAAQFWNYLKPHIAFVKDCGSAHGCYENEVSVLNGTSSGMNYGSDVYYKFILADGGVMWFRTSSPRCAYSAYNLVDICASFFYDVNGDKKPNTFGRDVFMYAMTKNGVFPYLANDCYKNSTNGIGCSAYIIQHGDMKYLH